MDRMHYPWNDLRVYVGNAALTLGLTDWQWEIDAAEPGENASADSFVPTGRKFCRLRFSDTFWNEYSPAEQRATIYHELFHCALSSLDNHIGHIKPQVTGPAWDAWATAVGYEMEKLVDSLAEAVAPQLAPLPRWKKGRLVGKRRTEPEGSLHAGSGVQPG